MVNIAVLGFGTVGSGVVEVLDINAGLIKKRTGDAIFVKYIVDVRDFPDSPYKDRLVKDFSVVENDPDVQIVVEAIGGKTIAYEFTKRALKAGKHVATSNKELVATHGAELMRIADEKNLNYFFEASVGGGIPVIHPIQQCLCANEIIEISGILNGTTNYILTNMIKNSVSFDDALKDAQAKGYAELDPSADVDGHDACRKICILSSLAFGSHFYPDNIPVEGIRSVALADAAYATPDYAIKLLGRAVSEGDGRYVLYVAPHLVKNDEPLAAVEDVFNGVMVTGNAVDKVMFYGRGAGKMPTASAVVSDVMEAARHLGEVVSPRWPDSGESKAVSPDSLICRRYMRLDTGSTGFSPAGGERLSREGAQASEIAFILDAMDGAAYGAYKKALPEGVRMLSEFRVL